MTVCFVRGRSESDQSLRLDPHRPGLNLTTDFHRLATRQSALSVTPQLDQRAARAGTATPRRPGSATANGASTGTARHRHAPGRHHTAES